MSESDLGRHWPELYRTLCELVDARVVSNDPELVARGREALGAAAVTNERLVFLLETGGKVPYQMTVDSKIAGVLPELRADELDDGRFVVSGFGTPTTADMGVLRSAVRDHRRLAIIYRDEREQQRRLLHDLPGLAEPSPSSPWEARAAIFPRWRGSPASEADWKHTMGSVADKITKKIVSSRGSKVVDLASWREGRKMALEAGLGDEGPTPAKFAGLEPCHGIYALAENVASLMAESISGMREAKGYARIVGDAEDEYMPSGPPMSPLTVSYFTMWALFDVRFGSSRETMGSCILRIAPEFDCPSWLTDTVERMQQSRMGFFVHCGSEGEGVLLREVGTGDIVSCAVPAGYAGSEGQIWFVRVLPPPHPLCRHHVVFNTPYVIRDYPERAYVDYLERELARMKAKKPRGVDDALGDLMKYGPDPNHWNEYIHCGYSGHRDEAIFLTGIPDIRQSLPHASAYR